MRVDYVQAEGFAIKPGTQILLKFVNTIRPTLIQKY